jgi:hypothetical protein
MTNIEATSRRHPKESAVLDEETLDPSMQYRFIQERPTAISRAKLKGYRVVRPSEDGVKTRFGQEDEPAEDIIKHGDRILMAIPKASHHQHRSDLKKSAIQRLSSNEQRVRQLARENKIKLHDKYEEDDE